MKREWTQQAASNPASSIGVIAPVCGVLGQMRAHSTTGLVDAVMVRYQHWLIAERPVEAVLGNPGSSIHHVHQQREVVEYAPQFRMELVFAGRAPGMAQEAPLMPSLVTQLLEREVRRETVRESDVPRSASSTAPGGGFAPRAAAPVETVLQSKARPIEVRREERQEADWRESGSERSRVTRMDWPAPRPEPVSIPEPEMARVADHVIRAIERRVTAQRERLGRR